MRVGGVLAQRVGEIFVAGDERVDEAEDVADAPRHGPMGIGLDGGDRGGGGVGHEQNKNTKERAKSGRIQDEQEFSHGLGSVVWGGWAGPAAAQPQAGPVVPWPAARAKPSGADRCTPCSPKPRVSCGRASLKKAAARCIERFAAALTGRHAWLSAGVAR
jgi:hypothetical protein